MVHFFIDSFEVALVEHDCRDCGLGLYCFLGLGCHSWGSLCFSNFDQFADDDANFIFPFLDNHSHLLKLLSCFLSSAEDVVADARGAF